MAHRMQLFLIEDQIYTMYADNGLLLLGDHEVSRSTLLSGLLDSGVYGSAPLDITMQAFKLWQSFQKKDFLTLEKLCLLLEV
jgi:hypothetical protein